MKKEIEIKVPNDWSAVSLKDYLNLRKDMDAYKDEPEAIEACLFHHLCKFPVEYLDKLDFDTYYSVRNQLNSFLSNNEFDLQRFITIDGVEYGFEPNLSQMAYGAYVDIAKYDTLTIDDNWSKIMSILYRPVTKKTAGLYDIKAYDAIIDGDKFMDIGMDIHFGALFFFYNLLKDLQISTLKSLMTSTGMPHNIKSILEESGNLIQASFNSRKEIFLK